MTNSFDRTNHILTTHAIIGSSSGGPHVVSCLSGMRSLFVSFFVITVCFSLVFAADKNSQSPKTVKDGKVRVEGTVMSIVDIERAEALDRMRASMMRASIGMAPVGTVTFRVTGNNGIQYACDIPDADYPKVLQIGDTVTLKGNGNHQQSAGVAENYRIQKCKVSDRRPILAKHVTLDGTMVEHRNFPPGAILGSDDTFRSLGPSDTFQVKSDGKVYSCFVELGSREFRSYREGDKLTISGTIREHEPLVVQNCRVESHEYLSH